ncbi:MAG: DUF1761 domain-containing protein [Chloroflexi bacterium]|nr:DUF1761 domain-containing protein [Chloroflexota bacterium]
MEIAFGDINYLAVAAAIILNMVLGALWYGPLFGKPWMALNNLTMEMIKEQGSPIKQYAVAVIASVIISIAIAFVAEAAGVANAAEGAMLGAIMSVGLVATAFGTSYMFESKALRHYLINAGYPVAAAVLIGTLIGAWQ